MCNIAGYIGEKRAAPILIEMLRRQEGFDGGVCTGIVTLHEGRLYYRKVVGGVDALLKATDAMSLPGTVGIAHSRPGGDPETYQFAHPFITYDERMAAVTNGTVRGSDPSLDQKFTDMLEAQGYKFRGEAYLYYQTSTFPKLKSGAHISVAETRLNAMHYYHKKCGMSLPAAMSRVDSEMYKDGVIALLSADEPDRISVLRTTRPAVTMKTKDGTYLATTRFAFPDEADGEVQALPVLYPCQIFRGKTEIHTADKMTSEEVAEPSAYTFEEGYRRIAALLIEKRDNPLHFDDLELAVWRNMRDLFDGNHTLIQDARLVYDVLWRLHREGRLCMKPILTQTNGAQLSPTDPMYNDARNIPGSKVRLFFWIEE